MYGSSIDQYQRGPLSRSSPKDSQTSGQDYCGGKIGNDPRSIICYVNSTTNWWWWKDTVYCCPKYFTIQTLEEAYQWNKLELGRGEKRLDLRNLQNTGATLLHEMMHARRLTLDRPHLIDETFDGSNRRVIYGPVDVAKAARIYTLKENKTLYNADSYSQFANAAYWEERFGILPQPTVKPQADNVYVDGVSDAQNNYVYIVCPLPPSTSSTCGSPNPHAKSCQELPDLQGLSCLSQWWLPCL